MLMRIFNVVWRFCTDWLIDWLILYQNSAYSEIYKQFVLWQTRCNNILLKLQFNATTKTICAVNEGNHEMKCSHVNDELIQPQVALQEFCIVCYWTKWWTPISNQYCRIKYVYTLTIIPCFSIFCLNPHKSIPQIPVVQVDESRMILFSSWQLC